MDDIQYIRTPRDLPDDQCTRIAVKSRLTGEVVAMPRLGEKLDAGADLTGLQRTANEEMPGHVVSVATEEEVRAFEQQRRLN